MKTFRVFEVLSSVDLTGRPIKTTSDLGNIDENDEKFIVIIPEGYDTPSGFKTTWYTRNWGELLASIPDTLICWDGFAVPASIFPYLRDDSDDLEWYLSTLS